MKSAFVGLLLLALTVQNSEQLPLTQVMGQEQRITEDGSQGVQLVKDRLLEVKDTVDAKTELSKEVPARADILKSIMRAAVDVAYPNFKDDNETDKGEAEPAKDGAQVPKDEDDVTKKEPEVTEKEAGITKGEVEVPEEEAEVTKKESQVTEKEAGITKEEVGVPEEVAEVTKKESQVTEKAAEVPEEERNVAMDWGKNLIQEGLDAVLEEIGIEDVAEILGDIDLLSLDGGLGREALQKVKAGVKVVQRIGEDAVQRAVDAVGVQEEEEVKEEGGNVFSAAVDCFFNLSSCIYASRQDERESRALQLI